MLHRSVVLVAFTLGALGCLVVAHPHHQGHKCMHDNIMDSLQAAQNWNPMRRMEELHKNAEVPREHFERARKLQSYAPIRITVKYDLLEDGQDRPFTCEGSASSPGTYVDSTGTALSETDTTACTAADIMFESDEKYSFLVNQILADAVTFFETSLSVIPATENIDVQAQSWPDSFCFGSRINSYACCESVLPLADRTSGVAGADFVLYVTKRPTTGSTLAWALPCQQDLRTLSRGRPTVGHANFSPARISTDPAQYDEQLSTAIHEIAHALGFTNSKFSSFINPATGATIPRSSVVLSTSDSSLGNKYVNKIITPNVIDKAKEHFGCENWPDAGLELEDYGGSGTAGSHWEKRIMANEYMTGTLDPNSVYSALTLALFEDTGWYQVDYSRAQRLVWGNGEGCDFVRKRCVESWDSAYFCTTQFQEGCTVDGRYRALCNLQPNVGSSLDPEFQYFSTDTEGGASPYVDYCPYFVRLNSGDCSSELTDGAWHYGEKTHPGGPTARCFSGTFVLNGISSSAEHAACLDFSCNLQGFIEITLHGFGSATTVVTCPAAGGLVDVSTFPDSTFQGLLDCPVREELCSGDPCEFNDCSGHGTCDSGDGTCDCDTGFYGSDGSNFNCAWRDCPIGTGGQECSGAAQGSCTPSTGVCECVAPFKSTACELQGCRVVQGQECSGTDRGVCNDSTGLCECNPGFIGTGCEITDCPGSPRCGGTSQGTCDETHGLCSCSSGVDLTTAEPIFYSGADCSVEEAGTRPSEAMAFIGDIVNGTEITPTPATLQPKEFSYFHFDVRTVSFPIAFHMTILSAGVTVDNVDCVASYDDTGVLPNLITHEFDSSTTGTSTRVINFERFEAGADDGTGATGQSPFDRLGRINIGVVANLESPVDIRIELLQDPCASLECVNGPECSAGRCTCPAAVTVADKNQDGVTEFYSARWSGEACDSPKCFGTESCSGRGVCSAEGNVFSCACDQFFEGVACQRVVSSITVVDPSAISAEFTPVQSNYTGEAVVGSVEFGTGSGAGAAPIEVGGNYTVVLDFGRPMSVLIRLESSSADSDPMLFTKGKTVPSLTSFDKFDVNSWTSQSSLHTISAVVQSSDLYFITVLNSRYGLGSFEGTLYYEVAEICPPSLTFPEAALSSPHYSPNAPTGPCAGHGVGLCADPSPAAIPVTPTLCTCESGWEGVYCQIRVPALASGVSQPVPPAGDADAALQPGDWRYYLYTASSTDVFLQATLTQTSASSRAQPLMLIGRVTTRDGSSLNSVQELALFDFDAYTNRSRTQTVRISRSTTINTRPSGPDYFYVGVHNTVNARAALTATLLFEASSAFPDLCPTTSGPAQTECFANAREDVCNGRGDARFSEQTPLGSIGCQCATGWRRESYCASPKGFSTFRDLVSATQSINFLCNVCDFQDGAFAKDAVRIFTVPQPLQRATGLTLSTVAAASSNATFTDPTLMVAPYLPRSIADFTFVSSTSSVAESVRLDTASPTGNYWVALYANTPGAVQLQAERSTLSAGKAKEEVFVEELANWLGTTQVGNVVLLLSVTFLLCVCLGCCCQHLECKKCRPKRKASSKFGFGGSSRNLGMFDPSTPDLASSKGVAKPGRVPLGRRAPAAKATPAANDGGYIVSPLAVHANPMTPNRSIEMTPPPAGPPPVHVAPRHDAYELTPVSTPRGSQRTDLPPPTAISVMPDGSALPPPPSLGSAPRSIQMRLRGVRASIHGGQAGNILGPAKAVPPPPAI